MTTEDVQPIDFWVVLNKIFPQTFIKTYQYRIATKCWKVLSGLFSPNLIDQLPCKMGLVLACVVRILHDDWSIRMGENRLDRVLKHLVSMFIDIVMRF